jgi:hypothetical protein
MSEEDVKNNCSLETLGKIPTGLTKVDWSHNKKNIFLEVQTATDYSIVISLDNRHSFTMTIL